MSANRTTRRAIVSGAAAASIGITCTAIADTETSVDSELIELGRALDPVLAEWAKFIRISDADQAQFERAVFAATGISLEDAPPPAAVGMAQVGYWRIRDDILKHWHTRESDLAFERRLTEIEAKASPVVRAVLALPARTLAGIAVKARAAAFVCSDLWRCPKDNNDQLGGSDMAALLENICTIAGVPSLAAEVGSAAENLSIGKC